LFWKYIDDVRYAWLLSKPEYSHYCHILIFNQKHGSYGLQSPKTKERKNYYQWRWSRKDRENKLFYGVGMVLYWMDYWISVVLFNKIHNEMSLLKRLFPMFFDEDIAEPQRVMIEMPTQEELEAEREVLYEKEKKKNDIINAQKCKEWYENRTGGRERHKERIAARKYFNH